MKKYLMTFALITFTALAIFSLQAQAGGECDDSNFMGTSFMC
jgi:hypothetical protein